MPLRRVSIIGAIFFAALGLLLLLQGFGVGTFTTIVQIITFAILIAGVALIIWAIALKNSAPA